MKNNEKELHDERSTWKIVGLCLVVGCAIFLPKETSEILDNISVKAY